MKYLLDTGVWLWSLCAAEKLNDSAREILDNGQEEIYLSAVDGPWEVRDQGSV